MYGKQPDAVPHRSGGRHLTLVPAALPGPGSYPDGDGSADGRGPVDIHAWMHPWIDGELPAREAASVGRRLAREPALAAHAVAYRAQVDGLHALYDPVLEEPIPPQLMAVLARRRVADSAGAERVRRVGRQRRRRRFALAAAGAVLTVLSGGLILGPPDMPPFAWTRATASAPSAVVQGP